MLKCFIFLYYNGNYYRLSENKNTCVMAIIMIYENNGGNAKKVYRVLSCVVYSIIDNYVCIEYLLCQSKTLSSISSKQKN